MNSKTSVFVGASVLVAAMGFGTFLPRTSAAPVMSSPSVSMIPTVGRYQIVAVPIGQNTSAFVLDTVTGQVWEKGSEGFPGAKLP
jgi:hypothetical protein